MVAKEPVKPTPRTGEPIQSMIQDHIIIYIWNPIGLPFGAECPEVTQLTIQIRHILCQFLMSETFFSGISHSLLPVNHVRTKIINSRAILQTD